MLNRFFLLTGEPEEEESSQRRQSCQSPCGPEMLRDWEDRLKLQEVILQKRAESLLQQGDQLREKEAELHRKEEELEERRRQFELLQSLTDQRPRSFEPSTDACQQAQTSAAMLKDCSDQLQGVASTLIRFDTRYRELIAAVGQACNELNGKLDCAHLWDGLTQLCLLARRMEQTDDLSCIDFGQALTGLLRERFGCTYFLPQKGETFDALTMEQEVLGPLSGRVTVDTCAACGWRHGDHVLCKAVVSLNREGF